MSHHGCQWRFRCSEVQRRLGTARVNRPEPEGDVKEFSGPWIDGQTPVTPCSWPHVPGRGRDEGGDDRAKSSHGQKADQLVLIENSEYQRRWNRPAKALNLEARRVGTPKNLAPDRWITQGCARLWETGDTSPLTFHVDAHPTSDEID